MRLIKALLAGIVLAAIVVGPPWALLRYIGNPWPAEGVSMSAPLTDGAIIGLLAVIVWVLWAQLVACILVEATAAITDDRIQVEVPFTLGVQQHLARRLITAVVVATVATPVAAAAVAATSAGAVPPAPAATFAGAGSADHKQTDQQGRATSASPQDRGGPTSVVTVMRLDSLWSIAERHLGDGDRWPEIAALNEGRIMNDGSRFVAADHIRPGWELRVPGGPASEEEPSIAREITVETGDTLSEIALDELGDAQAYPQLFEASTNIDQPGGEHLRDPDLIQPGWTILIPGTVPGGEVPGREAAVAKGGGKGASDVDADSSRPRTDGRDSFTPFPRVVPQLTVSTELPGSSDDAGEASSSVHDVADEDGHALLRALLATAGCLSVGALGLVMTNRRRQFRRRRVGRTIASTPPEVVEVEQAIVEHGAEAQQDVTFLDRALRHVAGSCKVAGDAASPVGCRRAGR